LDIADFGHAGDFEFQTKALGTIYCEQLQTGYQTEINKKIDEIDQSSTQIARHLLLLVGHKPDKNPDMKYKVGGEKLSEQEVAYVTDDEIDIFSREFVKNNAWFLCRSKSDEMIQKEDVESDCDFLVRAFKNRMEIDKARLEKLTKNFFSQSTLDSINESMRASDQIGQIMRGFRIGGIAEQAMKEAEKLSKISAVGQYEKLSELSGIGEIGAVDKIIFGQNDNIEKTIDYIPPKFPENPIHETNRRLNSVVEQMEKAVLVSNATSEMIKKVHDTAINIHSDYIENALETGEQTRDAIKISERSFYIAIAGFIVSTIFSILTLVDAREGGEKTEQQIKLLHKEIDFLEKSQKEDRIALTNAVQKLSEKRIETIRQNDPGRATIRK
jgi:hypothetical protein